MGKHLKGNIAPSLVLIIICAVVTAALAGTYILTKPVIETNTAKTEMAARQELLPEAGDFQECKGELAEGVASCYEAKSGEGIVVSAFGSSYGGQMDVMVGIDGDGNIKGVKVINHKDTPGLGSKVAEADYLKQYAGVKALDTDSIKTSKEIDSISGATISSDALYQIVKKGLGQYKIWEAESNGK